jgi:hypothetical protein
MFLYVVILIAEATSLECKEAEEEFIFIRYSCDHVTKHDRIRGAL